MQIPLSMTSNSNFKLLLELFFLQPIVTSQIAPTPHHHCEINMEFSVFVEGFFFWGGDN